MVLSLARSSLSSRSRTKSRRASALPVHGVRSREARHGRLSWEQGALNRVLNLAAMDSPGLAKMIDSKVGERIESEFASSLVMIARNAMDDLRRVDARPTPDSSLPTVCLSARSGRESDTSSCVDVQGATPWPRHERSQFVIATCQCVPQKERPQWKSRSKSRPSRSTAGNPAFAGQFRRHREHRDRRDHASEGRAAERARARRNRRAGLGDRGNF